MSNFHTFQARSLRGQDVDLSIYAGKVVLVVNTASKCGFTPQYAGLETLYKKYADDGFVVLGFPCNQFGNQEPGDSKTIEGSCLINYGVSFPMFEKIRVNGENAHPLFYLAERKTPRHFWTQGEMELHKVSDQSQRSTYTAFFPNYKTREY